jgi:hypothetical protein
MNAISFSYLRQDVIPACSAEAKNPWKQPGKAGSSLGFLFSLQGKYISSLGFLFSLQGKYISSLGFLFSLLGNSISSFGSLGHRFLPPDARLFQKLPRPLRIFELLHCFR